MENKSALLKRSGRQYIRVTYPNGDVVCYKNVTLTFLEVLRRLNIEQLQNITLEMCRLPLISQEVYPHLKEYMKPIVRGWYLNTQSDSKTKYMQLRSINESLNLGLQIEIGEDLEPSNTKGFQGKTKTKENMLVKFSDGTYIAEENAKLAYLAALKKIGVETLQRKGLEIQGKPLISYSKLHSQQELLDEYRVWVTIPNSTKGKQKALTIVALMMRINLTITIV